MNQLTKYFKKNLYFSIKDIILSILIITIATTICFLIRNADDYLAIALIYLLSVVIIARVTNGYFYGILSCFVAVFFDNFFFTYPYYSLNFSMPTYPLTFLSMLITSIIICTLTTQLKAKDALILEARMEKMRSNLLLAISHDLRTPLTSILGASSAIIDNYDMISRERRIELLHEVHEEADWLIHMVENLLYITKMSNENTYLTKKTEIAEEIISEAVSKIKKRYPHAPIHIVIPDEILLVPMDAMLIEQVIMNLLENAIRHGETATEILITLQKETPYAVFKVEDNGVGIAEQILPHLFDGLARTEKNNRVDSTKDFGIGLSVCKSIIIAHNGTIEAKNNVEGGGACFQFKLPLEEDYNEQ